MSTRGSSDKEEPKDTNRAQEIVGVITFLLALSAIGVAWAFMAEQASSTINVAKAEKLRISFWALTGLVGVGTAWFASLKGSTGMASLGYGGLAILGCVVCVPFLWLFALFKTGMNLLAHPERLVTPSSWWKPSTENE